MELESKLILLKQNVSYSLLVTSTKDDLFSYYLQFHNEMCKEAGEVDVWGLLSV